MASGLNPVGDVLTRVDRVLASADTALSNVETRLEPVDEVHAAVSGVGRA
jgi:hypothetical protein